MEQLEFVCTNCEEILVMQVTQKEYNYFQRTNSFEEGSEAFQEFFNSHGWVLQQDTFCDICKYNHSECYQD